MGASNAKLDTINNIYSRDLNEIKDKILKNSEIIMEKIISIMDLLKINANQFDSQNLDPDSDFNVATKNNILQKVIELISIYYVDDLYKNFSRDILENISKDLKFGVEILPEKYKIYYDQSVSNKKKSLLYKYGIKNTDDIIDNINDAKLKYAQEIVMMIVEKYLITFKFNQIINNFENSSYMKAYIQAIQSNNNLSNINNPLLDDSIRNEIKYRLNKVDKALKNVYEEIYQNMKSLNISETSDEVNEIKINSKKSPNKSVNKLCKNIDKICDVINIDNLNDNDLILSRRLLNEKTRNKVFSNVCSDEENKMSLFNLDSLENPCNVQRINNTQRYIEEENAKPTESSPLILPKQQFVKSNTFPKQVRIPQQIGLPVKVGISLQKPISKVQIAKPTKVIRPMKTGKITIPVQPFRPTQITKPVQLLRPVPVQPIKTNQVAIPISVPIPKQKPTKPVLISIPVQQQLKPVKYTRPLEIARKEQIPVEEIIKASRPVGIMPENKEEIIDFEEIFPEEERIIEPKKKIEKTSEEKSDRNLEEKVEEGEIVVPFQLSIEKKIKKIKKTKPKRSYDKRKKDNCNYESGSYYNKQRSLPRKW